MLFFSFYVLSSPSFTSPFFLSHLSAPPCSVFFPLFGLSSSVPLLLSPILTMLFFVLFFNLIHKAEHNKRFKPKATYEPRKYSVKEVKMVSVIGREGEEEEEKVEREQGRRERRNIERG